MMLRLPTRRVQARQSVLKRGTTHWSRFTGGHVHFAWEPEPGTTGQAVEFQITGAEAAHLAWWLSTQLRAPDYELAGLELNASGVLVKKADPRKSSRAQGR